MANIVCMKWGDKYGPQYVNTLHSMVRRHTAGDHRFVCFTDDAQGIDSAIEVKPLPPIDIPPARFREGWRKICLLNERLDDLTGQALFLDLDLIVVDSLEPFFQHPGEFCIIHNWTHPERRVGNSSVFRWEIGKWAFVAEDFAARRDEVLSTIPNSQTYMSMTLGDRMTFWPDEWCVSFKKHCIPPVPVRWWAEPRIPAGAKIVVFHGLPNPEDAVVGRWPRKWHAVHKLIRPARWIHEHYR